MKMLKGAGLWFAILGAFTLISYLSNPGIYKFTFNPSTFGILLIIVIIGIPIQASFEEIFFRGYLMQGFGLLSKKPIIPLLVTSILFAILHGANGTSSIVNIFIVLQILIVGIMLGIIALGENRIETAMGVHIANNIYAFLIVSSSDEIVNGLPSILTAPPSAPADLFSGLLTTIIAVLIVLTILFWGKKDKLFSIFRLEDAENV
jgi:membrane protease YdiL (CAAX protease family)